jgi:DNA-directed RNA polymerase subunit RPC12/RpoP
MDDYEVKRCAKCWRYLPLSDFGHDGRTRDHLTYRCNDCRAVVETHTSTIDHHGDI